MVMYGIYNSETLEKLINTAITTPNEKLFASKLSSWDILYVTNNVIGHYSINSLLYLRTIQGKYFQIYKEFISQLCIYERAIRFSQKVIYPFLSYHHQNYEKF